MNLPKISVITVVWNDAEGLERTIKSVINQTYENVEFIVIDGDSSDGTVEVIEKYADKIDYWVSEKDEGIYDAMNKGIKVASGMWVNFMNAGDTFVSEEVLQSIEWNVYNEKTLIYGNKMLDNQVIFPLSLRLLEAGEIHANHQSMFFNKSILQDKLFYDLKYKIYADYELVNRIYKDDSMIIKYIDVVIADFEGGGVSSTVSMQKRKDKYMIVYKSYGMIGLIKSIFYRVRKLM